LHERSKIIKRETVMVLALYSLFFVWWYASAYGMGGGDPLEYKYICGFPEWFFYSCIVGYFSISLLLWLVVRIFFKEISFEGDDVNE